MSQVIVFGASATQTWEPIYEEAVNLGRDYLNHKIFNRIIFIKDWKAAISHPILDSQI